MSDKLLAEILAECAAMRAEARVVRELASVLLAQRARAEPEPERYVMAMTEAIRAGFDSVGLPADRWSAIDAAICDIYERASRLATLEPK